MSEFHAYPKWKYHAEKEAVIIHNPREEAALGPGWVNTPAEFLVKSLTEEGGSERDHSMIKPTKKRGKS